MPQPLRSSSRRPQSRGTITQAPIVVPDVPDYLKHSRPALPVGPVPELPFMGAPTAAKTPRIGSTTATFTPPA